MVKFVTNRGVSHELVRHRHCSFAQESTRYVKYDGQMEFIKPVWCQEHLLGAWSEQSPVPPGRPMAEQLWLSAMERVNSDMDIMESLTASWESRVKTSACPALSAVCLVMEAICSREEEVSSRDAACSDAPSAKDWLEEDICPEAAATWAAPSSNSWVTPLITRIIPLEIKNARPNPIKMAMALTMEMLCFVVMAA